MAALAAMTLAGSGCEFHYANQPALIMRTGDGAEYLAHEVIIKLRAGASTQALASTLNQVGGQIQPEEGTLGAMAALGYYRVKLPNTVNADQAISQLTGEATVARAERSYLVHANATPNDPRYGELWGMAKIGAPAAWDTTTGAAEVLVAVSDTGIDYTHPDLAANVWTNPGEIPGNGKDDDGNGYIDDVHGYDFANSDADPFDDNGHGSHVSGTIGGVGNNGVGVAGINWKVRIQAVKFLSSSGSGSMWGGAQTILYAAKMKARVVNASWGCLGPSCYASYIEDAIKTLADAGGLFVAAAGNSSNDNDAYPNYPANYAGDNIVAVAATDSNDALASFSDWGATRVHLGAPGVGILSSTPNNTYASWSGTSMATPHVVGAAALFFSVRPDATYAEVKQKLMDTADKVPALAGKTVSGGRLNLARLIAAAGKPPAAPAGFNAVPGDRTDVLLSWTANTETDLASYRVRWGTSAGVYPNSLDVAKTSTSARVTGLMNGTKYFFVVYALSDKALLSPPSPEKSVIAVDRVAPPQVVDLAASTLAGRTAVVDLDETSGEYSPYWAAANAIDENPDTAWMSPARLDPQEEFLSVRLLVPELIDAVELVPNAAYPAFFPVDFDIETSLDGSTWTAVGGQRNAVVAVGDRVRIAFPAALAGLVRLRVLRSYQHDGGLSYASIADLTVHESSSAPDALTVTFTAPGDDPGEGTAQSYDLRRSTAPLTDATFASAVAVPTGAPHAAGVPESVTVSPLAGETTYYFALRAVDEAGNLSPLSNVASATTLLIPPATITDLTAVDPAAGTHPGMINLRWTAPGADGKTGQAARYDLRWSTTPMTAGDFATATPVAGVPAPAPAGATETFAVGELPVGRTYYLAIRAIDANGAAGGISNIVAAVPANGDDHTAPATVKELFARFSTSSLKIDARVDSVSDQLSSQRAATNLLDGDVSTAWSTAGAAVTAPAWVIFDYGSVRPLVRFRTNPSTADLIGSYPQDFEIQTSIDKLNWTTMVHVEGLVGTFGQWNDWSGPVTYARYARLNITRRGPATGAASYAALGEFETYALTPAQDAELTWVAPGDDGYDGTAARYDLRQSTAPLTEANFSAATVIPTLAPLHGGLIEVVHLADLPSETTVYFALRAVDGSGNWSALSNVASLTTPGVPPAPVTDLALAGAATTSVALSFTASGDDGTVGRATAYELRYAKTPLSPQTWSAAALAVTGAPQPSGTKESITVAGLDPTTLYYFGVVVIDDVGNRSTLSNIVSTSTLDGTPPARIVDLTASTVDPTQRLPLALSVTDSSGAYSPDTAATNLLDANQTTVWISPGSATVQPMSVTLGLGGSHKLGRLRMRAGIGYTDLFPLDFRVEVQAVAGGSWKTVASETGFTSPSGNWEEWTLGAVPAVAARLTVTKTTPWNGKFYTALGDLELYEDPADYGKLRLSWTASGDDGNVGTATSYDIRRALQPITDGSFASATPVSGPPAPHAAGYLERFDVSGLTADTTYCFGVKAVDENANASPASNSSCATTGGMPPATVTDLAITGVTASTATLGFVAPGADGALGTAARYELRRSSSRINTTNWDTATPVDGLPAPHVAGTPETLTVTGLSGLTTYYFALRAVDAAGNVAGISNNAMGTTADDIPPGRIIDLAATTNTVQESSLSLTWTAPGDNGMGGQAQQYDIRVSSQPITDATFAAATPVPAPAPKLGGSKESLTVTGLAPEQLYFVAMKTIDASGNVSALSNGASARTRDQAPSAIGDLAVIGGSGRDLGQATLVVQWTAPGDDANVGTASSYDIRSSTGTLTAATFAAAQQSLPGVAPAIAGTRQQYTVTGLNPGVRYTLAIKATDDRGNVSALSNVVSFATPDEMAPGATTDLAATTGATVGTLNVSLTAPGDDGVVGTAQAYDLRWSLNALDASSFAAAAALTTPAPAAAGAKQTFVVSGLPAETVVHLMLRTRDDAGNLSVLSNDASVATPQVPPAAISDLAITGGSGPNVGQSTLVVQWTAPGEDGTVGTAAGYDIRTSSSPITLANFAAATVSQPGLAPAPAGTRQQYTITGLNPSTRYYIGMKTIDKHGNLSALSNIPTGSTPDEMPPSTTTDLAAATGTASGTLTVSLTAPGDDGTQGTAQAYDLRWSLNALDAGSFAAAAVLPTPAPAAGGARQTFTVSGLPTEAQVHLMLRTRDDAGLLSGLSNDATARTLDVPPAAITDVRQIGRGAGSITLGWTAPGDDDRVGTAVEYDLRYAQTTLTDATFAAAPRFAVAPPHGAGFAETATVTGLVANKTYSFAVKTKDDRGNWSALSNVFSAPTEDTLAPGAISDLAATTGTAAGSVVLRWTATGDDGGDGTATRYDLRRSTAAITAGNWDAATSVTAPTPRISGSAETVTVTGLKGETTFHFAIRAVDEAGNTAALSNDAAAVTAPVAPAAVVDLAAKLVVASGAASATLTWTAPGDDGTDGQAVAYDIRYATSPITAATFATATAAVAPPAPQVAGSAESLTIAGLHESTNYYFALKTVDDTHTWSGLSNVASVVVPDLTKPAAPSSLIVSLPDTKGKRIAPSKVTASSLLGPAWDANNVTDGDPTSAWASAGNDTETPESLILDLGAVASIDQIQLTADAKYLDLFPRDFTLAVSADASAWKTVVTEESFSATAAAPLSWGFPAESGRYVRLAVTHTGTSFGKHYAIVADVDAYAASATDGRAQLTWLAPGDDGYTGRATQYQLYRATHTFGEADLSGATLMTGVPAPLDAGMLQTMLVTGLRGETTYFWALRAIDEAGNVGALSAVAAGKTNDVPPAAVRNLAGKALGYTEVQLTWTATGDDDTTGTATSVELRYLPGAISSQNFATAELVSGLPVPASSGVAQAVNVTNLAPGVAYHFALVAKDAAGNASHLSNVAVVTTQRLPDILPPATITDLTVALPPAGGQLVAAKGAQASSEQIPSFAATAVSDGDSNTFWASAPRLTSQEEWVRVEYAPGTVSDRVRVWPSASFPELFPPDLTVRVSPDGLAWTTVASKTGIIAVAGQPTTFSFTATPLRFVEVRATRLTSQASGAYYAAIAELQTLTASAAPGTAVISWTAPADDGPTGQAASTDLHIGPCPIDMANAPAVATGTPSAPGTPERARASGLTSGATYCAAIRSTDDAGNVSALSNIATIVLP